MNSMLRQHHIRLQDLSNYLRGYDPAKPQAPEEWSKLECQGFQPGMLIFCMDAVASPPGLTLGKKAEDHGETYRVKDLCVVVGEDNGKTLVVNITASAYELRFLEVLLLEKARKAILDGKDFHYVVVRPSQALDDATKRGLDQLGNIYAQGGSRRSLVVDASGPQEPAMALLQALGVKLQMTGIGKQVLDIGSICHMLFAPEGRQEDKNKVLVKACFTPIQNTEAIGYGNGHPPGEAPSHQAPEQQAAAWNEFDEQPPAQQQEFYSVAPGGGYFSETVAQQAQQSQEQWPEQTEPEQGWAGPEENQSGQYAEQQQGWTQEEQQQPWPEEQQQQPANWQQQQQAEQQQSGDWPDQQQSGNWPDQQQQSGNWPDQQQQSGNWPDQQQQSGNWPDQQQQSGNWEDPGAAAVVPQVTAEEQWQQQTQSGGWPQQSTSNEWQPEAQPVAGTAWPPESEVGQTSGDAWPPDQGAEWTPGAPAEEWAQPGQPNWSPPPDGQQQGSWPDQISGEWPQTEEWQPGTAPAQSEWTQPEAQAGFKEYEQPSVTASGSNFEATVAEQPAPPEAVVHDYAEEFKEPEYSQTGSDFGTTDFTDASQFAPELPPEAPPNAFAQTSDQTGWQQQPLANIKRSTFGFDTPTPEQTEIQPSPFGAPQQQSFGAPHIAFPPPGPEPSAQVEQSSIPAAPDFAEQFKRDFEQGMTSPQAPNDVVPRQKTIDEEFNEVIFGTAARSTMDLNQPAPAIPAPAIPAAAIPDAVPDDEWTTPDTQSEQASAQEPTTVTEATPTDSVDDGWTSQPAGTEQPDLWAPAPLPQVASDATRSGEFASRSGEYSIPQTTPAPPPLPPPLPPPAPPLTQSPASPLPLSYAPEVTTTSGVGEDNLTLFERLNQKLSKPTELQPAEQASPPHDDGSYKHLAEALSGLMHSDRPSDTASTDVPAVGTPVSPPLPFREESSPPAPPVVRESAPMPEAETPSEQSLPPPGAPQPVAPPFAGPIVTPPPPQVVVDQAAEPPAIEYDTGAGASEPKPPVLSSDTWISRAGTLPEPATEAASEPMQTAEPAQAASTQPYWTTPAAPTEQSVAPVAQEITTPIVTPPPPAPVVSAPIITPPPPAPVISAPIITPPPPAPVTSAPIITPPPPAPPVTTAPPAPPAFASPAAEVESDEASVLSTPKAPTAGFQEPRAVMNEMATLMSKLEQQVAKAAKKLSSRAEEVKARLVKQVDTALAEAAHSERQTDASLGTLSTRLTKELEDVSEEVRLKISDVAANGRYTIKQLYTSGQGQLEETKNELYESLREACKQFRTDTENLTRDTEMQLHKLINQRMDELHDLVDAICERLDDTGDTFVDKLMARFQRFRERMTDESDAVINSLERSARSMNEEIESAWERVLDKLKSSRGDFDATVDHNIRTAELTVSQYARKHLSELLLPKLRERKDVFRGMTGEMTRRFTEESESQVRGQMLNLEANLSAARQQLQNLAQECMASIDAVGRGQQAGLEDTFKDTSTYVEKTTSEVMLMLQNTEKQITDAEVTCKKLAETSSVDADPRLTEERNQSHSRVQQLKQQSQTELATAIENGCGRLEQISQELHNQLAAERVEHTRSVRDAAESGLSQIREAIQETFNAIQAAREKYME